MRTAACLTILLLVGCSTTPKITITGDASVTGRAVDYIDDGKREPYGTFNDLKDELGELPPPPPSITIIPGTQGSPGTPSPGVDPRVYNQILSFLQSGPGGTVISLAHLQQITPAFMALAQYYVNNPNTTLYQLASSPQGAAFLVVAQSILQPLGLWNYNTLTSWSYYIGAHFGTLRSIIVNLYNQLVVPPPPGTPGTPGTPDEIIVNAINPFLVVRDLEALFKGKDWLLFAEKAPRLVHLLIKHVGFSFPRILLYGSRSRLYAPGIVTTHHDGKKRTTYVLNQEGFLKNEQTTGSGLFYQGPDDISLAYALIRVKDKRVTTLDAIASDRYAFLKRATGGDVRLLDRADSFATGLFKADVAFGEDHSAHVGLAAGSTPFAKMGGVTGEVEYRSAYFEGRVGAGIFIEDTYNTASENLLGYVETENTLRTPSLTIRQADLPNLNIWGSTTITAAGMATRAVSPVIRKKKRIRQPWGGQGDVRVIPELNLSLDTPLLEFSLYTGVTTAVVPHGYVKLSVPHHSLRPYPIRWHVGGGVRLRLTALYRYVEEAQKLEKDRVELQSPPPSEWLHLSVTGVGEFSKLFHKTRIGVSLDAFDGSVGFVTELESYLDEDFHDVRLGGGVNYRGFFARGVKSIKDNDYRIDLGFELSF